MSMTNFIILATIAVSVLALLNKAYFQKLLFSPYMVYHGKQWYRFLSHVLVHADWMHLGVNMYVLYLFGNLAESFYRYSFTSKGVMYYLLLYVGGALFSSLPAWRKHRNHFHYNAVGASGAVSSVLFATILYIPTQPISFFFIPVQIPAFVFGILYLAFEIYQSKKGLDNIAHDAHYWGAIFGIVFTVVLNPYIVPEFFYKIIG